ncbi:hypothetical protein MicloDRAFT_00063160 [Microvirga lotononidis]|uniref:Uncharacterized protein n=1 Tax=Microvirga lotononidis TaxID=864069 RepID=I4YNP7_9HYPH|nr:hypothetical protein MicloDRAFT_00063160 [Microvirga lotononidis]
MSWSHVTHMICASKLKSPDVLRNPTLPYTVYFLLADYAPTARCFPHLQTSVWRKLTASGRSHVFSMDEGHNASLGGAMR